MNDLAKIGHSFSSALFNLRSNKHKIELAQSVGIAIRNDINRGMPIIIDDTEYYFIHGVDVKPRSHVQIGVNMPENAIGEHSDDESLIKINNKFFLDGKQLFVHLTHEHTHDVQYSLRDTINLYNVDSNEYKLLKKIQVNTRNSRYEFAGIRTDGRVYVNDTAEIKSTALSDLSFALYKLSAIERMAVSVECFAASIIGEPKTYDLTEYIQVVQQRYNCLDYSKKDVLDLVDNVSEKIATQSPPTSHLEASLMYDMCAILSYQNNLISQQQYETLSNWNTKNKALAQYQIEHPDLQILNASQLPHTISCPIVRFSDLISIPQADLLNSPMIIAYSIVTFEEKALPYIPNINVFKAWCYSLDNRFPSEFMDSIAEQLGPEFSGKRCEEEQQKILDSIKKQEIDERIKNHNPNDMKFETHSHSQEIDGIDINQT